MGATPPRFQLPYLLVYSIAFVFEIFYQLFDIQPLFTRFEVNLMAITNTYSTAKAEQDLSYKPCDTDALMHETVDFLCKKYQITNSKYGKNLEINDNPFLWNLNCFLGIAKDVFMIFLSLLFLYFFLV